MRPAKRLILFPSCATFLGSISGRQCMLSLLEYQHSQTLPAPQYYNSDRLDLLLILRQLFALPASFTCAKGKMYEEIFSKPPNVVIKESVQLLLSKSEETASAQLGLDQVNLALKQLKLASLVSEEGLEEESLIAKIRVELIKIHICRCVCGLPVTRTEANPLAAPSLVEYFATPLTSYHPSNYSLDDLEAQNSKLRPFLHYLHSIKTQVSKLVEVVTHNKSFLLMGIAIDCEDMEVVKKYYKILAVKFHPDKPGGSKERFQALTDAYEDVLRKVREREVERRVLEKMGKDDLKMYHDIMRSRGKKPKGPSSRTDSSDHPPPPPPPTSASPAQEEHKSCHPKASGGGGEDEEDREENEKRSHPSGENVAPDNRASSPSSSLPETPTVDMDVEMEEENVYRSHPNRLGGRDPRTGRLPSTATSPLLSSGLPSYSAPAESLTSLSHRLPPFEPQHRDSLQHAHEIHQYLSRLLSEMHALAHRCAQHLHRGIKANKGIVKEAKKKVQHKVLERVQNLLCQFLGEDQLREMIENIQLICAQAQRVCSLAMSLPTHCGIHVHEAWSLLPCNPMSGSSPFVDTIEITMNLSMATLQSLSSLMGARDQLVMTWHRLHDHLLHHHPLLDPPSSSSSSALSQHMDLYYHTQTNVQSLLLSMSASSSASLLQLMHTCTDQVFLLTTHCTTVQALVGTVLSNARDRYVVAIQEQAKEADNSLDDYSPEDLEALRQARGHLRTTSSSAGDGQSNQEEKSSQEEDEQQQGNGGRRSTTKLTPEGVLEDLKDKIKNLQVQLFHQQVTALQQHNQELLHSQSQLMDLAQSLSLSYDPQLLEEIYSLLANILDNDWIQLREAFEARKGDGETLLRNYLGWLGNTTPGGVRSCDGAKLFQERVVMPLQVVLSRSKSGEEHKEQSSSSSSSSTSQEGGGGGGGAAATTTPSVKLAVPLDYRSKLWCLAAWLCSSGEGGNASGEKKKNGLDELMEELSAKVAEWVSELEREMAAAAMEPAEDSDKRQRGQEQLQLLVL